MPPALAARFTVAELAVLRIVGDEVRARGCCDRTIAEIAARAGVGRSTVKNAIREAAELGLVTVAERRRDGQVNLPNVIRVVSREWLAWLAKGPRRGEGVALVEPPSSLIGFRTTNPTVRQIKRTPSREPQREERRAFGAKGCR